MNKTYKHTSANAFGERIRKERVKRNWSQQFVAEKLGGLHNVVHTKGGKRELAPNSETIGRWERGVNVPSRYYRRLLSQVFQMSEKEIDFLIAKSVLP